MRVTFLFCFFLAILLLVPSTARANSAEGAPLRLASNVWPPYTDVEGKPRKALEIVEAALRDSHFDSHTTITSWDEVMHGLKHKQFDGCGAMWRTAEREEYLLFSEPYLLNRLVLIGRAGSGVEQMGITDLRNKRLALVPGYAYGNILRQLDGVKLVYGKSDAANFQAVYIGRADFALAEEHLVDETFKGFSPRTQRFMAVGKTPIFSRPLHFAIRKDYPGAKEIIAAFNRNIKK